MRTFVLAGILCFSALIAALHFFASEYAWYWYWPWFDVLMHYLGGALIGLGSLWVFFHSRYIDPLHPSKPAMLVVAVVGTIVVGIGWEVFEYLTGHTFTLAHETYALDTGMDLFMDLLGGLSSYLLYHKHHV